MASVDAQVSSRITATRLVTIGVFALAAKKKTGAVYLSIENPDVASVIECSQEDNTKAREFAVKITNAGKAAAAIEARLPDLILSAEQAVTTAVSDTAAIDAAQAELSRVEADPLLVGPIETAQVALTAAESKLKDLTAAAA
ncbi:hypothetical protein SAMN05660359_04478 [Geodermatophilus obscurus]|uniref:Uncharacterized protein n=1 Tax=Geodermatophilus obscurus TaxID=1861 RepID=A0A1I5IBN8_9ACTN|nr:hypothetical protein SAMN05660359_04478 [Geodermatophilus obscurus]